MKRSVFSKTLALVLCLILAFSAFTVNVFAADEDADIDMGDDVIIKALADVYVSASGSDSNAGTEAAPFATLEKALKRVANNGTIHIVGTVTVPAGMSWVDRNVTPITITGGTLNLASSDLVIGYNVIFKDITINGGKAVYANGNKVTFESGANASAVTVYGGSNTGATLESTNLTINGGTLGTVYGGSSVSSVINQVNLTVNGGTVANLFGGSNSASLTGNVTVFINGGTITDSIFGGCNNEYTYKSGFGPLGASITWDTTHYVTGKVDVIVSESATINTNNSSGTDKAFFAHSRHKTLSANEDTSIIFTSQTAYNNNSSKFGTKASNSGIGTSNNLRGAGMGADAASSADNVHIHGLTADDTADTITEGCSVVVGTESDPCGSTVATLSINPRASLSYTGKEITPAVVTVTGSFTNGEPALTYSNNVEPGTATATMSYNGLSVSKDFTIEKATQKAPRGLTPTPETISGMADGQILGLSTEMEYSTDGSSYTTVTDANMYFAFGTYYVRYAETDYLKASESATVVVEEGRKLTVTFIADGVEVAVKEVSYGETLTDIPEVPEKVGYTMIAPYWDGKATNVTEDITITAVYVKDFILGDVDNDGKVNLNDLITLAQYVAGWENIAVNSYALDISGDGTVDLTDVNTLAQYLAGWDVTISKTPYMG